MKLKGKQICNNSVLIMNESNEIVNQNVNESNGTVKQKIKITEKDIEEEILFWKSAMLCYVLGANPPITICKIFVEGCGNERLIR